MAFSCHRVVETSMRSSPRPRAGKLTTRATRCSRGSPVYKYRPAGHFAVKLTSASHGELHHQLAKQTIRPRKPRPRVAARIVIVKALVHQPRAGCGGALLERLEARLDLAVARRRERAHDDRHRPDRVLTLYAASQCPHRPSPNKTTGWLKTRGCTFLSAHIRERRHAKSRATAATEARGCSHRPSCAHCRIRRPRTRKQSHPALAG